MSEPQVYVEKKNGVATVTLNVPERLNALNVELLERLCEILDDCASDGESRALVLTGAGRGFCAGADLSGLPPEIDFDQEPNVMDTHFNEPVKKLVELPIPTIAAVNGVAAGGGYGVALACDLTIAAQSASFVLVFTPQLGIIPDMGASWHPPRRLGRARAMAAAFFGEKMSAEEAVAAGLIWRCVPDDELQAEAQRVARDLAAGPTLAYAAVRKAFDLANRQTLQEQLYMEARVQPKLLATHDFKEGVRAFRQKRKPKFEGR